MALRGRYVGQGLVCLLDGDLTLLRCKRSLSSLIKFSSATENDNFWLKRLDHKDWLAPNEVLKVFRNLRDPELIMGAFGKASSRLDYKPNEALYGLLVDRLGFAHKFDAIDDLLDRAKSERCRLSDDFFYKLIKVYGNIANHPEKAISTLYGMPEFHCWPTVKTFNYVLNMLVCYKHYEIIHEVFLSASRLGVSLDTCCFNILIKGLCQANNLEAAFSLFYEISKHGLRPNATTYATLMHALCKHGRLKEAFEVCEMMERDGCSTDAIIFNVLISGSCKEGRVEEAMGLLKRMMLKGCYPNTGTYQALLYGLIENKRFMDAKNLIGIMISDGRHPSFLSYKLTIEGLCSEKHLNEVDSVLKQMVGEGFVPRMGTWKKIIGCMFSKNSGYSSFEISCI
ncbi:hypothetical protein HPP92_011319 [Vanilla planifolia]|nr:hypothetical protein HPP92_011319 [Vanilla planifolia]